MSFPSSCSLERYTSVAGEGQGVGGRIVSALDDDGRMGPGREKRLERDGCYSPPSSNTHPAVCPGREKESLVIGKETGSRD